MSARTRRIALRRAGRRAFTLIELMIVLAIMATLAAMVVPRYWRAVENSKETVAIEEIEQLAAALDSYEQENGHLPDSLDELGDGPYVDPWGNPYRYLNFATAAKEDKPRKDKFLHPLNTTYDLYSMGPDGDTKVPLTAAASRDDIIRANDGDYVGIAEGY